MIYRILLIIQIVVGAVLWIVSTFILDSLALLQGFSIALFLVGIVGLLIHFWRKSRKLSDKEKRSMVGTIERKVAIQQACVQKAGSNTFCVSVYFFIIAVVTALVSRTERTILWYLVGILGIQLLVFWAFYSIERLKKEP